MKTRTSLPVFLTAAALVCASAWPVRVQAQDAVTEVSVEHPVCFGACPAYKLTLRRDGTATYVGLFHVAKVGTYTASLRAADFHRLAQAITQRGFDRFKLAYTVPITDQTHVITTVVQGGRRKTVDNYADTGPQALWEIQTLIDGFVAEAHWKKVSSKKVSSRKHQ